MRRVLILGVVLITGGAGYLLYQGYQHGKSARREAQFAAENRRLANKHLAQAEQTVDPDDRQFLTARAKGEAADVATLQKFADQERSLSRRWYSLGALGLVFALGLGFLAFRRRRTVRGEAELTAAADRDDRPRPPSSAAPRQEPR